MSLSPDGSWLEAGMSRRKVLGITVAGAASLLTAACGGGSAKTSSGAGPTGATSGAGSPAVEGPTAGPVGGGNNLVATSKVPVGGGVFVKDGKIIANPNPTEQSVTVITQPAAGTFKAFDATCTHAACTVGEIQDGTIICPCHGSMYSVKDGSVLGGPAPAPLAPIAIKVEGTEIVKA
jgi:Rieske Fe-S protein